MGRGRDRMRHGQAAPAAQPEQQQRKPKIGAGWGAAFLRQGAKELAQVLPAFPANGIQPVEEPGTPGNLTPKEVYDGKGLDKEKQADAAPQKAAAKEREIEPEMG